MFVELFCDFREYLIYALTNDCRRSSSVLSTSISYVFMNIVLLLTLHAVSNAFIKSAMKSIFQKRCHTLPSKTLYNGMWVFSNSRVVTLVLPDFCTCHGSLEKHLHSSIHCLILFLYITNDVIVFQHFPILKVMKRKKMMLLRLLLALTRLSMIQLDSFQMVSKVCSATLQ